MSVSLAADRTIVWRLRIRRGATDPMLARLRAATLLSSVALTPTGLSPAAILLVRRLQDPMPGKLGLRSAGIRPPQEWERAVRAQLEGLARRALRPARDGVADTADAVLFADHGELLACLARDWLRGSMQRWWWQTLFQDRDAATAVVRAWLERSECIPAAMAHLASTAEDIVFVSRIGQQNLGSLLQSVLSAHALPELLSALAPVLRSRIVAARDADAPPIEAEAELQAHGDRPRPPWRSASASGEALPKTIGEAFVGVCHALYRAPHMVRSRDFVEKTRQWAAWKDAARSAPRMHVASIAENVETDFLPQRPKADRRHDSAPHEANRRLSPAVRKPRADAGGPSRTQLARDDASPPGELIDAGERHAEAQGPEVDRTLHREVTDHGLNELRVETQFGGVFFLVNVALFLGLYGDFAYPARGGLALSIWDFIALVAEDLAGPPLRDDPVWMLLARLAGRAEGEEPGRLLSPRRRAALRRWLKRLLPRLRLRLRQALGTGAHADVGALLLRLPARVWVTPTRLDASFALAELPIEVRRSGLDRDPGWVPAAGRSIRFHFD